MRIRRVAVAMAWVVIHSAGAETLPGAVHAGGASSQPRDLLESLESELREGEYDARLRAIDELGAVAGGETVLIQRFGELAPPIPGAGARQPEKTAMLRVLAPKLETGARREFLMTTIRGETLAMREAALIGRGIYYPLDLLEAATGGALSGCMRPSTRDELRRLSADTNLPRRARQRLMAEVLRYDYSAEGVSSGHGLAQAIVQELDPSPVAPIPWAIYRDTEARITYAGTRDFQETQTAMSEWAASDQAVLVGAREEILRSIGGEAVKELRKAVFDEGLGSEVRDYAAWLATKILREISASGSTMDGSILDLAPLLREYAESMEDTGAFGRRHRALSNLDSIGP